MERCLIPRLARVPNWSKNQSFLARDEHLIVALSVASRRLPTRVVGNQVVRLPVGEG